MASRATQSLATGMKIMGGANMPMYTLEFLDASGRNSRGSFINIVVPYAVLGRDKSNAVPIGDEHGTVSRKHAAIERVGKEVRLLNLSQTNPTLVNGQQINTPYYLKNGDEIQLSLEGPKLRFNETQTGTAKMGFTNRMNLVIQQSIKPYKTAAFIAMTLVLLTFSVSGYFIYELSQQNIEQKILLDDQEKQLAEIKANNENLKDELREATSKTTYAISKTEKELERIQEENKKISDSLLKQITATIKEPENITKTETIENNNTINENNSKSNLFEALEIAKKTTLYITLDKIIIERIDGDVELEGEKGIICTGFLTDTGKLVTARHCIDNRLTSDESLNFVDNSGGSVVLYFTAKSYDGTYEIEFTNKQMTSDYSRDKYLTQEDDLFNDKGLIRIPDYFNGSDWAYIQTKYKDGLKLNASFSTNIPSATDLHLYGYSYGSRYRKSRTGNLEPYYSTAKVKLSGIRNGLIYTSESSATYGNSGGPVMTLIEGELQIIGLLSGGNPEVDTYGVVTPATYFAN